MVLLAATLGLVGVGVFEGVAAAADNQPNYVPRPDEVSQQAWTDAHPGDMPTADTATQEKTRAEAMESSPSAVDDFHDDFINVAGPAAQAVMAEYGVPASVGTAQSILESNWGRSSLSQNDKNYFGFKCTSASNPGPIAIGCHNYPTQECTPTCHTVNAYFRVYASMKDSFRDYGRLLSTSSLYAPAFQYVDNPDQFAREIARHYATDPDYANKVIGLMQTWNLYRFNNVTPPKTHLQWLQRDSLDGGAATRSFVYGLAGDLPLVGDWDGNGSETPGVYRPAEATFYLRNSNTGGAADIVFRYGTPGIGQWPVVGDWDGNGTDTIGVFNLNTAQWLLRNTNNGGNADTTFTYGTQGDLPVVGDWNGNGSTAVGVRRGNTWLLRNHNSGGNAEIAFTYGRAGDFPLVGDWNGNRTEGIGVVQGNTWLLRYSLSAGDPQITFAYGRTGDIFVTGDWNHNGRPDVGVVRTI